MSTDALVKLGIIGCGEWGSNHVRIFSHLLTSKEIVCADSNAGRLQAIQKTFLSVKTTTNYRDIIADPGIQAVCIATPAATHYAIAKECLESGKDVLCEKPLCLKEEEVSHLIELAAQHKRILMVGHVFLFNAGILALKRYIHEGALGNILYAHSARTNLGPFRYDVDVVLDLATHDISIFNFLFDAAPLEVSARGHKCLTGQQSDLAFITLLYPANILVNIHVSWIDPKKVRLITLVGEKKMVIWDDITQEGPIRIYDKHVEQNIAHYETFGEYQLFSKEGDIMIPKIESYEPLKAQNAHFLECMRTRQEPMSNGRSSLSVVRVLTAIEESMRRHGEPQPIQKE
ncbi:MAG: Gfo/Idh/MocA family oxidoreductase [Candidatus Omnitrophica bacterium]|nr:Gfo/Idh/MocA family oxidoreductase [Candidatus Omnitrophota bacterium]